MRTAKVLAWAMALVGMGSLSALAATVGELKVPIREYDVATPQGRPHDPAVAPDGALWYTAQRANKLGRLDPRTGAIKEYPLKTADSGPHGLVADPQGKIWFTAAYKGYVGRLDPQSGEVAEFKMPDPRARDPHTPVFDSKGILWFTVESGNFIGRLDPRTGRVTLKEVPTPKAIPYGIVVSSRDIPYFSEFGTNKLASIDPDTLAVTEYPLPEGAHPRRLAITQDDVLYYTDYARGYLGRFDPKTGRLDEWPSPGGPGAKPYGIAIAADGRVWYSESGVMPNTLIRFDPRTEAFARETIPSGGGVVRNMVATRTGSLYLACSGVNKVAVVETR